MTTSVSVFLAAGLSYRQYPSVPEDVILHGRKRGVKCEAELNDLGAAGSLQEAK